MTLTTPNSYQSNHCFFISKSPPKYYEIMTAKSVSRVLVIKYDSS